jgi:hypothetical protein
VRRPILELLLEHHPACRRSTRSCERWPPGGGAFAERDRIEIGLRELVEAGLAHRLGSFVFSSHATASFDRIWAA